MKSEKIFFREFGVDNLWVLKGYLESDYNCLYDRFWEFSLKEWDLGWFRVFM